MKVYQINYYSNASGYYKKSYHSNKIEAKNALNSEGDKDMNFVSVFEVSITKKGFIDFLNTNASYPDNG